MSNRTEHHDKIQQITAKLIELNNNFANADALTALDIELLRKYAVDLYDKILLLEPEKQVKVQPTTPKVETPKEPEVQITAEPVTKPLPETVKEEKIVTPTPPVAEKEEKQPEVKPEEVVAPKPVEEVEPVVAEQPVPAKPIIEEKEEAEEEVTEQDNSLNASHTQPEAEDLASKLGQTPIHDLKKAISINKKFEFISQLFDGDHEGYTKSVHYLNGLKNRDKAMTFFDNLKKENNWDDENKRYIEFADLVSRRFM